MALLAYILLEEGQQRLQRQWQRTVSIGEARGKIQHRYRRLLFHWLFDQFQSGGQPDSFYDLLAA